jgi:Mg2+ and Co2+ transporter CorA
MNEESYDMDDAVAAIEALHDALTSDLEELETRIRALGHSILLVPESDNPEVSEFFEARASLHSGLASIAEVLAWIQLKTEEDPEGEVATALQPLPKLRGCVIH